MFSSWIYTTLDNADVMFSGVAPDGRVNLQYVIYINEIKKTIFR